MVRNLQMHGIPSSSLQVCAIAHAYRTNYLCVNYKRFNNKQRDNLLIPVTFVHVYMFYIWNNTDLLKIKWNEMKKVPLFPSRNICGEYSKEPSH